MMSQALSKKKTCYATRSGYYLDAAGPTLHGQCHQQLHAPLQNQEPAKEC